MYHRIAIEFREGHASQSKEGISKRGIDEHHWMLLDDKTDTIGMR